MSSSSDDVSLFLQLPFSLPSISDTSAETRAASGTVVRVNPRYHPSDQLPGGYQPYDVPSLAMLPELYVSPEHARVATTPPFVLGGLSFKFPCGPDLSFIPSSINAHQLDDLLACRRPTPLVSLLSVITWPPVVDTSTSVINHRHLLPTPYGVPSLSPRDQLPSTYVLLHAMFLSQLYSITRTYKYSLHYYLYYLALVYIPLLCLHYVPSSCLHHNTAVIRDRPLFGIVIIPPTIYLKQAGVILPWRITALSRLCAKAYTPRNVGGHGTVECMYMLSASFLV